MAAKKKTEDPVIQETPVISEEPAVQETPKPVKSERKFEKRKLICSARYADSKDVLCAVLEEGRLYTVDEVDTLIAEYKKGKVK